MIMMMSRMVYDDDGDGYGGADDGDDGDDDAIFAILQNSWSSSCALYNATRRLSLRTGSLPILPSRPLQLVRRI